MTIELEQAQQHLLELIERASAGEEIILTKDHLPFVKLVSMKKKKRQRPFGTAKGQIMIAEDFDAPLEDFREYT
jgi:prevent-host-death family protein